jgi:hypothetical protein
MHLWYSICHVDELLPNEMNEVIAAKNILLSFQAVTVLVSKLVMSNVHFGSLSLPYFLD